MLEDTKLETWDARRAKSLCHGRRKAQTINNQSKQYVELKKKEWTQSQLQTTREEVVREDPTERGC